MSDIITDLASLYDLIKGSDSKFPSWWKEVKGLKSFEQLNSPYRKTGGYQGFELNRVILVLGEKTKNLILATEGYPEGYVCEFFESIEEAQTWRESLCNH